MFAAYRGPSIPLPWEQGSPGVLTEGEEAGEAKELLRGMVLTIIIHVHVAVNWVQLSLARQTFDCARLVQSSVDLVLETRFTRALFCSA